LVGLVSANDRGEDVTGSAAEAQTYPYRRAYFELVERAALLDALHERPDTFALWDAYENHVGECSADTAFPLAPAEAEWVYARSNGVAAGPDWQNACRSARAELIERHRVLSAWYGFSVPAALDSQRAEVLEHLATRYRFEAYEFFDVPNAVATDELCVVGIYGFPSSPADPLLYGLGAAEDLSV